MMMRLSEYLTEGKSLYADDAKEKALKAIKKNGWMSPEEALAWAGKPTTPIILFRGTNVQGDKVERVPRVDRAPKDTDADRHDELDKYFLEEFGWKARSEGVFVTPDYDTAWSYTDLPGYLGVFIIIPDKSYKYIWSAKVRDLMYEDGDVANLKYKDTGLEKNKKNEVMIKCSKYKMLNVVYFPWWYEKYGKKSESTEAMAVLAGMKV
jgi:hypothetical protein